MRIRRMGLRPAALLRSVGSMRDKWGEHLPFNDGVDAPAGRLLKRD